MDADVRYADGAVRGAVLRGAAGLPVADRVVAVVGPTATGKSDLAVALAGRLGGEVVNADSMQLYAGMDIGTAKLPAASAGESRTTCSTSGRSPSRPRSPSTRRWPGPRSPTSAGAGRVPVLVGGSGLYLRGALDRLEFPGESPPLGPGCTPNWTSTGAGSLHAGWRAVDPAAAAAILPEQRAADRPGAGGHRAHRRPVHSPGCPASSRSTTRSSSAWTVPTSTSGSSAGAPDDGARLPRRGARAAAAGLRASPTAGKALGYAQLLAVLDDDGTCAATSTRRSTRPSAPPGGSSAASGPGSAATRGSTGSTPAAPDLPSRALTL